MVTTFEEELNRSGKLVYTNVGVSMLPLLREGRDIMIIEKADDYRPLDAVLFRRPGVKGRGAYVLHRILKACPDGRFWIIGDNCISGEYVDKANVLGVLTGVVRDGKLIKNTDLKYQAYVRLWCGPYHLRIHILKGLRFARRVRRFIKRRHLSS
ncbi:MAG: S24/S26 family peptidase [Lachnospiraceae bacterium]|nr:S24/S26 family peptidase [Lachnospiraceae bacterium]